MAGPKEFTIAFIAVIVICNVAVSVALVRSHFYTPLQKLAQVAIIWFIPLFGAVGIWAFLRAQYRWQKYDTRAFPERTKKGVAVEVQNAIHENLGGGGGTPSD